MERTHENRNQPQPIALITGATGFVGRHLIREIRAHTNWQVIGLARTSADFSADVRLIRCDLMDAGAVHRIVSRYRPAYIFHLAAQSYVPRAMASPADTLTNNIIGQVNLLEAIRSSGDNPIVLIVSSGEVYGAVGAADLPIHESQPLAPRNPYAVSKATQDLLGFQYHASNGVRTIRARPFNHIGPGQDDRFVIGTFARQIVQAEKGQIEPTILTGNLDVERDFLDVRDVVRAYRLLAESAPSGEVFNIASGRSRRIGDLLRMLIEISGVKVTVEQDPARVRQGEVMRVVGDATRLRDVTGWAPVIGIERTLQDTLEWWRHELGAA